MASLSSCASILSKYKLEEWRSRIEANGGSEEEESEEFILAANVSGDVYERFTDTIEKNHLPKSSMRFENGTIRIYEVPCQQHEGPLGYFSGLLWAYSFQQESGVFDNLGRSTFTIPSGDRGEADACLRHTSFSRLPVLMVEIGWSETFTQLDNDAQFWLASPDVQGVIIFKIYKRRINESFAMVCSFYDRGGTVRAGGGIAPAWATEFGTAPIIQKCVPSNLGTIVDGPFSPGALPWAAGNYTKTIPCALLYRGVDGLAGGDFHFDLFDLQAKFSRNL